MRKLFSFKPVSTDLALRALAISMVAINHANFDTEFALGLGGGMTFLMMLSGYNFARFALQGGDPERVRQSIIGIINGLFWPSLAIVLFCFALLRTFEPTELLFIHNWFGLDRVAKFPVWYVQVLLQILAVLLLLFSVPFVALSVLRRPLEWSFGLLCAALLVRVTFPLVWDTSDLAHHLPHLYFWNFVLGWFIYFAVKRSERVDWKRRWLVVASAILVASSAIAWDWQILQFWWLSIAGLLLIWMDKVSLPRPVAWLVVLVSQATFVIFLTHRLFYEIFEDLFRQSDPGGALLWLFGMAGGVLLWVAVTSVRRARSRLDLDSSTATRPRRVVEAG